MPENDLSGSASIREIAKYYKVSAKTMRRRLKPYWSFFTFTDRKRVYYENELQFIKRIFGEKVKGQLEHKESSSE